MGHGHWCNLGKQEHCEIWKNPETTKHLDQGLSRAYTKNGIYHLLNSSLYLSILISFLDWNSILPLFQPGTRSAKRLHFPGLTKQGCSAVCHLHLDGTTAQIVSLSPPSGLIYMLKGGMTEWNLVESRMRDSPPGWWAIALYHPLGTLWEGRMELHKCNHTHPSLGPQVSQLKPHGQCCWYS